MNRSITSATLSIALALVVAGSLSAADEEAGGTVDTMNDVVNVERASVRWAGSEDAEVLVSGTLPSSCHQPVWEVLDGGDAVQVWLWSWPGDDPDCVGTQAPFDVAIPLGDIDPAAQVLLDGQPVSWATNDPVTALTGAGWSFGMCLGLCEADIELSGDQVVMTGRDRELAEPVFVNQGRLTADGMSRIHTALAALDEVTLEPVYGCPDCADGGAASISLQRESGETKHQLEYGQPPAELSELYDITSALGEALQTCVSDELITVADGCLVS